MLLSFFQFVLNIRLYKYLHVQPNINVCYAVEVKLDYIYLFICQHSFFSFFFLYYYFFCIIYLLSIDYSISQYLTHAQILKQIGFGDLPKVWPYNSI